MKQKMTPLHGRFDPNGVGVKGTTMAIAFKKAMDKKVPGMSTKLNPMCDRSVAMDGYTGKSTPKGSSGEEAKAPKTAKPMYR